MAVTPTLQDLIANMPPVLGQGLMSPAEQQAEVERITSATLPEALRKYGTTAQQIAEGNFGRGFGLSSYNAYQQALNTLMQQEGTAAIQNEAQRSVDAAQNAAVGQAASYTNQAQNRSAVEANQKRRINANTSAANRAAIIGGLGNLGFGTAGVLSRDLMRPAGEASRLGLAYDRIKEGLGFGGKEGSGGVPGEGMGGTFEGEGQGPSESAFQPSYPDSGFNLSSEGYNFGDSTGGYSLNVPDFKFPDFSLDSLFNGYSMDDFFNPALF